MGVISLFGGGVDVASSVLQCLSVLLCAGGATCATSSVTQRDAQKSLFNSIFHIIISFSAFHSQRAPARTRCAVPVTPSLSARGRARRSGRRRAITDAPSAPTEAARAGGWFARTSWTPVLTWRRRAVASARVDAAADGRSMCCHVVARCARCCVRQMTKLWMQSACYDGEK